MLKTKFDFFERVKVICPNGTNIKKEKWKLNGSEGTIIGKSIEGNVLFGYGVSVDNDEGYVWDFEESELESLGVYVKKEDYYTEESIKVGVTEKGQGYIKTEGKE